MKQKKFEKLVKGDKVWHTRYGVCEVVDYIPDFGPIINPVNQNMKGLLVYDSGAEFDKPLLETQRKLIKILKELDEETLDKLMALHENEKKPN